MKRKYPYKLIACCLFLAWATGWLPQTAYADDDYKFYKKHGHSNKSWNEMVKQGFAAYEKGDCNQTIARLKEAIRVQCQDGLVYFKLAVCTEAQGSPYTAMQYYQLAQEKLEKLPSVHPYQKDIFENYGRALYKAKRYKEALPYLTRAAAVGAPSFGLYYMVGNLYAKQNDPNGALDYYKKALTQDHSGVPPKLLSGVFFEVAKTYFQNKDYKTTVGLLNKAIQLDPENQEAKSLKGKASLALQQNSMVEMIQNLTNQQAPQDPASSSAPPPPAAAKLPPLEGSQDPTPPLGTPVTTPPQAQNQPQTNPSSPTQLDPLPPSP